MKILTDFETVVEGDTVTIKAKIVNGVAPIPNTQHTILHSDNKRRTHITHLQASNHGFFVRLPNKDVGVAIPAELWVMNVARIIETGLNPAEPVTAK